MNPMSTIHRDPPCTYLGSPEKSVFRDGTHKSSALLPWIWQLKATSQRSFSLTPALSDQTKLYALLTCSVWQEEREIRRDEKICGCRQQLLFHQVGVFTITRGPIAKLGSQQQPGSAVRGRNELRKKHINYFLHFKEMGT